VSRTEERLDDGSRDRSHPANAGLAGGEAVNPVEPPAERSGRSASPKGEAQPDREQGLWEQVFCRENLAWALQRVERNKGAPGVDGRTTVELRPWLHRNWPDVRRALDEGTYQPSPVRRVVISKPDGGERNLGVPTTLDRLIQQAIAQVLTPIFDPTFSEYSYGFRPGRSAHQAVRQARGYVAEGYEWSVAVDLEKFFDRVHHDKLMARVVRKVHDRRLLRLVRRCLEAGIMVDGVKQGVEEGTPQGSPLSPLLANIMLDDLDRELERRGHRFVRYADDQRIQVRSERAGERILAGIAEFIERRLKLKVNREKSSVKNANQATILGFGFHRRDGEVRIRIAPKALERMRQRVRKLTARLWSIAMEERIRLLNRYLIGWGSYFGLAETPSTFERLDSWIRRRLRQVRWKEWKCLKGRRRNLIALGSSLYDARRWAGSGKGPWRMSGSPPLCRTLNNRYWEAMGLQSVSARWRRLRHA
jgi:group II intron reverse transcriptase/maturase